MLFMGIDPGQSGGIAVVDQGGHIIGVTKMPDTERDIYAAIQSFHDADYCYIEQVHSMPKQGVASSFKFGTSYGGLRMALVAAGLRFETVTPQRWQSLLGCRSKGDKNVTKRRAQELFPGQLMTHAIADALLIAEYCRRIRMGV
jgi:Holliday junction resolvasome RuvABC endonuclease subunit